MKPKPKGQGKPQIIRDKLGRIVKGVAQDTNKNGTAGTPCKYCKEPEKYQKIADTYLERCKDKENRKPIMPFIEELAMQLDVTDDTVVNWAKKATKEGNEEHPEFLAVYAKVTMIQKLRLKQRALGRYNPVGALSLLRFDHGAIETSKRVIAGDKNEPIEITIVEEERLHGN